MAQEEFGLDQDDRASWGYIKISRKAYETDPFWLEEREFSKWEAWEWMIQEAAWKPRHMKAGSTVIRIERGQLLASLRSLAERWGWSVKRVRSFLQILEKMDRIRAHLQTPAGIVYALVNYDAYQATNKLRRSEKGTPGAHLSAKKGTGKGTDGAQERAHPEQDVNSAEFTTSGEDYVAEGHTLGHSSGHSRGIGEAENGHTLRRQLLRRQLKSVGQSVSQSGDASIESERRTEPDTIAAIVAAANAGMLDNPRLGEGAFEPLDPGDELHRETVSRWLAAGISPASIAEEVYRGAVSYRPRGDRRQIERLSYFERPIRRRHALDTSRHVERPTSAAPIPRDPAAVSAQTETAGATRHHTTEPREAPPEALAEILAGIAGRGWNLEKWLPKKPAA